MPCAKEKRKRRGSAVSRRLRGSVCLYSRRDSRSASLRRNPKRRSRVGRDAHLQDGLSQEQFREDAPRGPRVHGGAVRLRAEKQLGRAVPERDDSVGQRARVFERARAREPEVRELQHAVVVDEQVRALDVAMQDVIQVAVVQAGQELLHVAFYLRDREFDALASREAGQVVIHVLEHHVDAALVLRRHDLFHVDHVVVIQRLQDLDLAYGGDGKALAFALELHLLQRDEAGIVSAASHEHLTVRSLTDLLDLLVRLHRPRAVRPHRSDAFEGLRHSPP